MLTLSAMAIKRGRDNSVEVSTCRHRRATYLSGEAETLTEDLLSSLFHLDVCDS
jgi:hypothetical protein